MSACPENHHQTKTLLREMEQVEHHQKTLDKKLSKEICQLVQMLMSIIKTMTKTKSKTEMAHHNYKNDNNNNIKDNNLLSLSHHAKHNSATNQSQGNDMACTTATESVSSKNTYGKIEKFKHRWDQWDPHPCPRYCLQEKHKQDVCETLENFCWGSKWRIEDKHQCYEHFGLCHGHVDCVLTGIVTIVEWMQMGVVTV